MLKDSSNPSPERAENTQLKKVNWGPLAAIFVTIGVYIAGQIIGGILIAIIPVLKGWTSQEATKWFDNSISARFLLILAVEVVTVLMLYAFLRYKKSGFRSLGLIRPKLRDAGYALVGFACYIPLYILVVTLVSNLIPGLDLDQKQQIGFENAAGPELFLVFISLVILPPLIEEMLMRGFLYGGLRSKLAVWPAAIIASIIFAAAHLQAGSGEPLLWVAAIDTFVLSLVLIYLRERTGGLWASIGLHSLKNGVAFLVLFVFHLG